MGEGRADFLYGTGQSGDGSRGPVRDAGASCSEDAVRGAQDRAGATVQDVGVDHGRAHVVVTEELLDGPDVVEENVATDPGAKATSTPSAPSPPRPVPRPSRPQPRTPPPAGATGTAHISLRARPPRPPGCERDARRAHRLRQAPNDPPGSAGMTPRRAGTTASIAPSQSRSGNGRGRPRVRPGAGHPQVREKFPDHRGIV